jgi:hypothetical protein
LSDDRDRLSGTAQAGLKYDMASKLGLSFGAGADIFHVQYFDIRQ